MKLNWGVLIILLSGCYSGPLTPQASSAITQSAATLDPSPMIMERSTAYGQSLGAIGMASNQQPVHESRRDLHNRVDNLEESNAEKLKKAKQDVAELQKGW